MCVPRIRYLLTGDGWHCRGLKAGQARGGPAGRGDDQKGG